MSNVYEILDDEGNVVNVINASIDFVNEYYPGHYREQYREPVYTWVITKVAMISRFTPQEYVGIVSATKTDVEVQAWYDLFQAASKVDLQDERTVAGINALVPKNLITQARADTILTTPAQPNEIPS
jgi:hypothetical protein